MDLAIYQVDAFTDRAFAGKARFHARQVSARGGDLWLSLEGDRVKIAGCSVCVLKGTISI